MNSFQNSLKDSLALRIIEACTNSSGIAYAEIAPDLTIQQFSPNFNTLLNQQPTQGQRLTDLLWEFVGSEDQLASVLAGNVAKYNIERINRRQADGAIGYFSFHVVPLRAKRAAEGLLLVVEDVTDTSASHQEVVQDRNELRLIQKELARKNEELEQLNRFKSLLISMVSHDLRSPLTTIGGYTELLMEEWDDIDPQQLQMLNIVHTQTQQLNQILTSLLDLDQIERGTLTLNRVESNLGALVAEEVHSQQPLAKRRGQLIKFEQPSFPIKLKVDRSRMRQIIQNLLANAIKYTPRNKQIICSLSLDQSTHPARCLIEVADQGRGMSEEEQASLFQLYYRTKDARLSKAGGRGLGLYIVKMLVAAHNGEIWVKSKVGQGTTFTVAFPLESD